MGMRLVMLATMESLRRSWVVVVRGRKQNLIELLPARSRLGWVVLE